MSKRMFNLLLAVLMVVAVVFGPMTNTVAAVEEKEQKWTLVEFSWEQVQYNKSIALVKEYALVGAGNGEDVFTKLASDELLYADRYAAVIKELKKEANAEKKSEGISFVQVKGEPAAFTFKTSSENEAATTSIAFNGQEVAKVDGDSAFIIATWSMDDIKFEPAADDATLFLYHDEGCMNGEGVTRQLCNGCGLITVHDMLSFCGHSSCVEGNHEPAVCGYAGHKACYDRHGAARCGIKGHYVCTGKHDAAPCKTDKHYICDGKTHTACPGCGKLQCAKGFKASEHKLAACGKHYICSSGYDAANHAVMDCGHYKCTNDGKEHSKAVCGNHYKCAVGYKAADHEKAACGAYACAHAGPHTEAACGGYACHKAGSHEKAACGAYACAHAGPHELGDCKSHYTCLVSGSHAVAPCGGYACHKAGSHDQCTSCGAYKCQGSHTDCA